MTEKVGGIEYYVDADTDKLKEASEEVESSSAKMDAALDKVDATTKALNSDFKNASKTVTKTTQVIDKLGNEASDSAAKVKALKNEAARLKQEAKSLNKQGAKASKTVDGFGRNAGNAGIQIQQFAGQLQGGQSAMLALSQQGADLGIVLGAPLIGAMVGLGATAIGMGMAFMSTGDDVETLTEKLKELKKTKLLTAEQAEFLAKQEKKTIKEQLADQDKIEKSIAKLNKEIIESSAQRAGILKDSIQAGDESKIAMITNRIAGLKDQIFDLTVSHQTAAMAIEDSQKRLDTFSLAAGFGAQQTDEQKKSVNELLESLKKESDTLGMTERQLLSYALASKGATDEQKNSALSTFDLIKKKKDEAEAERKATIEKSKAIKVEASLQSSLSKKIMALQSAGMSQEELNIRQKLALGLGEKLPESYQKQIDKINELSEAQKRATEQDIANKKIIADFDRLNNDLSSVGMSELDKIQSDFESKRALILEHEAILLADKELTIGQGIAIEQQRKDALLALDEEYAKQRVDVTKRAEDSIRSIRSTATQSAINLLDTFAGKSKAAAIAAIVLNKGLALAQNTQNTLVAQTRALAELGPIAGPPAAATIGKYGAINAGLIAATGLAQAGSVLSGNSSSLTSSGGLPAQRVTSGGSGVEQNRNISIAGIDASSLITGGQLIDALNEALGDGYSVNFGGG